METLISPFPSLMTRLVSVAWMTVNGPTDLWSNLFTVPVELEDDKLGFICISARDPFKKTSSPGEYIFRIHTVLPKYVL